MAGLRLNNMAVFMVIMATGALFQIHSSEAQTTHTVGDTLGWTVPPGGPIAYSTWAATQNFTVSDILVFNFATNAHDVAEVTQAAFDGCNATNPISLSTTGPTRITLGAAGTHYYICTFGTHCQLGQKLAINVSAASSTPPPAAAPQPPATTPPPAAAPQPPTTTPPPAPAPQPPTTTPPPAAAPQPSGATPPPAAAPQPSGATPPSASTPTPSNSPPTATPPTVTPAPITPADGGNTPPPPPSSAPRSFAVAALPITFLSVALAFLY